MLISGKGSGSSSPVAKPVDLSGAVLDPSSIESQRPSSSKQRSDSLKIEGADYFMSSPRFPAGSSNSAPTSPASMSRYNVSFSPRITFHDTWPSGEYDRRGEIATCNRLTPMLAQQIKEELNTFKMVGIIVMYFVHGERANWLCRRWMFMRSLKFIRISSNDRVQRGVSKAFFFFLGATLLYGDHTSFPRS